MSSFSFSGLNLTQHCNSNHSLKLFEAFNLSYSISAMVTFLATTGILVAMIFYKAYHSALKRLFLYLTLSTMAYLANSSFNIQLRPGLFEHTGDTLCRWTGYIETCTFISCQVLTLEISIYLLFVVYYQVRGKPMPVPTRSQTVVLEVVGLLAAVVVPTCLLAIPFQHYGLNGAVCWVKLYNDTSCEALPKSLILGKTLFSIYAVFISVNLIAFVALFAVFIRLACKFQQSRAQYMQTARRTITLLLILVFYAIIHLSSILTPYLIFEGKVHWWKSLFVYCIFNPIAQFFRPLAYMFYFNSVKKFRWEETKMAAVDWRRSWRFFCLRCCHWIMGKGDLMLVNDLDGRSCEYITPSAMTSTQYDSLGRTSVE